MNTKAIAGYLNTKESEILRIEEWVHVYFVHVNGFRPCFVSKKALERFVAADKRAYNSGSFTHFHNTSYCKSYGSKPINESPSAKAFMAELQAMRSKSKSRISSSHPAAAFFPISA